MVYLKCWCTLGTVALHSWQVKVPRLSSGWTGCVRTTWPEIRSSSPSLSAVSSRTLQVGQGRKEGRKEGTRCEVGGPVSGGEVGETDVDLLPHAQLHARILGRTPHGVAQVGIEPSPSLLPTRGGKGREEPVEVVGDEEDEFGRVGVDVLDVDEEGVALWVGQLLHAQSVSLRPAFLVAGLGWSMDGGEGKEDRRPYSWRNLRKESWTRLPSSSCFSSTPGWPKSTSILSF